MKVLILAGGLGSRLSEETWLRPKPMVEIGERPILWHIMKIYSHYGFNDFVILLGYKGYSIKQYFVDYFIHQSDVTIDLTTNQAVVHSNSCEPWKVTLLDTGLDTMTGGRIKKAQSYVNNETFMLTYGDGVADINLHELIKFHQSHGKPVTMTSVQMGGRFAALNIGQSGRVDQFSEKPKEGGWINGGFFVCEPSILDYIEGDHTIFEREPLDRLAKEEKLYAYHHPGFWQCMDTLRDKNQLNEMWNSGKAQWKIWK